MANLTDQQEIFCHEIVKGKSQFDAYQIAYPASLKWKRNSVDNKASLMASNAKVVQRIERLRAPIVRKTVYTVVEAHEEAGRALELAMSTEQVGAAVAAVQLRAKLHGLITEKKEIKLSKFDDLEADDKQTLIETMRAEIARRKALAAPDQGVTDVEAK
jgi:hypothetical protein